METYGELRAEVVRAMGNRRDLGSRVDEWIQLAERQIYRVVRVPANEKILKVEPKAGETADEVTLPSDYLQTKIISINGRVQERVSDAELLTLRDLDSSRRQPEKWARLADEFAFWPLADSNYKVTIIYWADYSGTLIEDTDTTELLRVAPDAHLAGAMYEGKFALQMVEEASAWKAKFHASLAELNQHADLAEMSGSVLRVGNPR